MQTWFTDEQRRDPGIAESEAILRKCVHCGFCTATCPTYVLLGDELDSPRGRIYLIKDMLENDRPATAQVARHIDRCLSCLSCVTTCPSGVDYRRLIDRARVHVETTYRRPPAERILRAALAWLMPYPRRFRALLGPARLVRPLRRLLPARLRAMLELVPGGNRGSAVEVAGTAPETPVTTGTGTGRDPSATTVEAVAKRSESKPTDRPETSCSSGARVALLTGCVQSVIGAPINAATRRLLERAGAEVVTVDGCCGSIVHHLGREDQGRELAGLVLRRLGELIDAGRVDAVVSNASGCGAHIKDFGFHFRDDPVLSRVAEKVAALTRDVTELLAELGLPPVVPERIPPSARRVAYHSACSMQHAQRLHEPPRALLREAGFDVVEIDEGHLCCGSAGTYNMLQPSLARRLANRKLERIEATGAGVVAAGNLGCLTQLGSASRAVPTRTQPGFAHTIELLDWATGGPRPADLA